MIFSSHRQKNQFWCTQLVNQARKYEHQLKLFLNQPGLLQHYLQRNNPQLAKAETKAEKLKTIFPSNSQLQKFRHLQHTRLSAQRDLALDSWVVQLIGNIEQQVSTCAKADQDIEKKKENCLGKLKMDYVEQQMQQHLQQLQKLIGNYEYYGDLIGSEKGYVQKMITMTEIKKALAVQNCILKRENQMLKRQEEEIDIIINAKKKK